MNQHPILFRVDQLFHQGRFEEASVFIKNYLSDNADDEIARYYLAYSYYLSNHLDEARNIAERLISEDPEWTDLIMLLANIDIADDKFEDADDKANYLLNQELVDADIFLLKARVKFSQRFYDEALKYVDKALELDAENQEALNIKISINNIIQPNRTGNEIDKLLELNPENPSAIANHGMLLLHKGDSKFALERFKEALSLQPSNQLARYGMQEALRSKFWPYKLFYQFFKFTSKLSGQQTWMLIIGVMIARNLFQRGADHTSGLLSTVLTIVTVAVSVFIFLTWVITPLLNVYLLSNSYGRLLLEEKEKQMATFTGIAMIAGFISLMLYYLLKDEYLFILGILFIVMMIPLGTFLNPDKEIKQNRLKYFTIAILVTGLIGIFIVPGLLFFAVLGLVAYQFYYNSMMINDFSRKF